MITSRSDTRILRPRSAPHEKIQTPNSGKSGSQTRPSSSPSLTPSNLPHDTEDSQQQSRINPISNTSVDTVNAPQQNLNVSSESANYEKSPNLNSQVPKKRAPSAGSITEAKRARYSNTLPSLNPTTSLVNDHTQNAYEPQPQKSPDPILSWDDQPDPELIDDDSSESLPKESLKSGENEKSAGNTRISLTDVHHDVDQVELSKPPGRGTSQNSVSENSAVDNDVVDHSAVGAEDTSIILETQTPIESRPPFDNEEFVDSSSSSSDEEIGIHPALRENRIRFREEVHETQEPKDAEHEPEEREHREQASTETQEQEEEFHDTLGSDAFQDALESHEPPEGGAVDDDITKSGDDASQVGDVHMDVGDVHINAGDIGNDTHPVNTSQSANFETKTNEEILMEVDPVDFDLSSVPDKYAPLMKAINKMEQYKPYLLRDYLKMKEQLTPAVAESPSLDDYVITEMPLSSFSSLPKDALNAKTTEEFLVSVTSKQKRNQKSTTNREVFNKFWRLVIEEIGREWFWIIYTRCVVYRYDSTKSWTCLWGYQKLEKRKPALKTNSGGNVLFKVSKRHIVFKTHSPSAKLVHHLQPMENFKKLNAVHPAVSSEVQKIEKKLENKKFSLLSSGSKHTYDRIQTVGYNVLACLKKIVTKSFLGSQINQKMLEKNFRKYLKVSPYTEFPIEQAIAGMNINEFPWLRQVEMENRVQALCEFHLYLYERVLNSILYHHYYITSVSGKPFDFYYIQQLLWINNFQIPAEKQLISTSTACESNGGSTSNAGDKSLFPKWRPVPKANFKDFRIILNMKDRNKETTIPHLITRSTIPTNSSRIDKLNEWIPKIFNFRDKFPNIDRFYILKADVKGCFSNANVDKVLEIVESILKRQHKMYLASSGFTYDVKDKVWKLCPARICEFPSGRPIADNQKEPKHDTIFAESSNIKIDRTRYSATDVIDEIQKLLNELYIKTSNGEIRAIKHGIPQGSNLSSDLCDLLLDDYVANILNPMLLNMDVLVLRYVDDFLFVTTDRNGLKWFKEQLSLGFANPHGVMFNNKKMVTNIFTENPVNFLGVDIPPNLEITVKEPPPFLIEQNYKGLDIQKASKRVLYELSSVLQILKSEPPITEYSKLDQLEDQIAYVFGRALYPRITILHESFHTSLNEESKEKNQNQNQTHNEVKCILNLAQRIYTQRLEPFFNSNKSDERNQKLKQKFWSGYYYYQRKQV